MTSFRYHRSLVQRTFLSILSTLRIFVSIISYHCTKQLSLSASYAHPVHNFFLCNSHLPFPSSPDSIRTNASVFASYIEMLLRCFRKHFCLCLYRRKQELCHIVLLKSHNSILRSPLSGWFSIRHLQAKQNHSTFYQSTWVFHNKKYMSTSANEPFGA